MCAELGAVAALVLALGAPADAKSCTERLKTCQGFCAKTEGGSPGCLAKCGEYRQACLARLGKQIRVQGMRLRQAIDAPSFEGLRALIHRLLGRDPSEAAELVAGPGELPLGVMAGVELRA